MTIKDSVNMYIDCVKNNSTFKPREVAIYVCSMLGTLPYDSTVTRTIRDRKLNRGDVYCCDRQNSIYKKVNPNTKED